MKHERESDARKCVVFDLSSCWPPSRRRDPPCRPRPDDDSTSSIRNLCGMSFTTLRNLSSHETDCTNSHSGLYEIIRLSQDDNEFTTRRPAKRPDENH